MSDVKTESNEMTHYIGTKAVQAKPMTRIRYNILRGWDLPINENPDDEGYLVEYPDGGKTNVDGFQGYVSWSPKDVFERSYKASGRMSFGMAIEALKVGKRVARAGWNGKGMWLGLVQGYDYNPQEGRATAYALGCIKLPWIGMKTANGEFVPWLASQTDMLAEDWTVVEAA